jgi:hypothetical protein
MENLVNNFNRTLARKFALDVVHLWNCPKSVSDFLIRGKNTDGIDAKSDCRAELSKECWNPSGRKEVLYAIQAAFLACSPNITGCNRKNVASNAALATFFHSGVEGDFGKTLAKQHNFAVQLWNGMLNDIL